jgi:hypothetical protein
VFLQDFKAERSINEEYDPLGIKEEIPHGEIFPTIKVISNVSHGCRYFAS